MAQSDNSDTLTVSTQAPVSAATTVEIGSTVSGVWSDLFLSEPVQEAFLTSIRDGARGRTLSELLDHYDAFPGSLAGLATKVARGDTAAALALLIETRKLGTGHYTVEDIHNTADLFADGDSTPTVAFTIERETVEDLRRDQREDILELITRLSEGIHVRLVADKVTQSYLRQNHRDDLDGVSFERNTPHPSQDIDDALRTLSPDGREASILRLLEDEPTAVLTYHEIHAAAEIGRSRVRQVCSTLSGLGLIETYGTPKKAELLEAGEAYLDEIGRQVTLENPSFDPPKLTPTDTCNPATGESPPTDRPVYRTTYQNRPEQTTAVAAGLENDVSLVTEPVGLDETPKERRTKAVSYDDDRGDVVVSVRATNGLDYLVSVATALANPRLLNQIPVDAVEEPGIILREARNIGGLSTAAENDAGILRSNLIEWGEDLEALTTEFTHATGEDKKELGSVIMKQAHGLAGTIVHLLDAVGITVTREIRLATGLSFKQLRNLSESFARSVLIQSKYGAFAPYRHLLETDAGTPYLSPEIDAADPVGDLLGSFVIRGKDAHRIRDPLERALDSFDFMDDAPEFTVPVTVGTVGRATTSTAITRLLKAKNIKPTREAVSLLDGLTSSPYTASRAINQLGTEDTPREIRPDELRYALSHLDAVELLPSLPRTVGKVVNALLEATEPISQRELSDRAEVSTQSIRNNRDTLEALDLVEIGPEGWAFNLAVRTTAERRQGSWPSITTDTFTGAVDSLLRAILPTERYADPDDPVGGVLFHPPDPWTLWDHADFGGWIQLAAALTDTDPPTTASTIQAGPTVAQTAIQGTTGVTAD